MSSGEVDPRAAEIDAQAQEAASAAGLTAGPIRENYIAGYAQALADAGRYRRTVSVTVEERPAVFTDEDGPDGKVVHPAHYAAYFQGLGLFAYGDTPAAALARLKIEAGILIDALYRQGRISQTTTGGDR